MAFAANNLQAMIFSRAEVQPTVEVSAGFSPSRLPVNSGALSAFEVLFTQQLASQQNQLSSISSDPSKAESTGGSPTIAVPSLPAESHKSVANDDNTAVYSLLNPLLFSQTPSPLPKFDFSLDSLLSGTTLPPAATDNTSGESSDLIETTPLAFDSGEIDFISKNQATNQATIRTADEPVAGHVATSTADNPASLPTQFQQSLAQISSIGEQITTPQLQFVANEKGYRSSDSPVINQRTTSVTSAVSAENGANIDVSQFESVSLQVRATDLPLPVQKPRMNLCEPNFVNANINQIEQPIGNFGSSQKRSIADELAAEIERHIRNTVESGPTTVEISLDRPGLGRVRVTLSLRGKSVAVRIAVQNPEAQRLFNSQLSGLQQSLASLGIDCNEVVVGCDDSQTDEGCPTERRPVAARRWNDNHAGSAATNERNDRLSFVA